MTDLPESQNQANNTWTDEQIAELKHLATTNISASQIAESFPGRTRNAILGKLHRLGLHIPGTKAGRGRNDSFWSMGENLRELAGYFHSATGYSHHEIAQHFGCGMSTLRRGLAKMRALEGLDPLKPNAASRARRGSRSRPRVRTVEELSVNMVPLPVPQIELDILATAIGIMELDSHTCRWPVEGDGAGMRYCGRPPVPNAVYCGHHCRRAYAR